MDAHRQFLTRIGYLLPEPDYHHVRVSTLRSHDRRPPAGGAGCSTRFARTRQRSLGLPDDVRLAPMSSPRPTAPKGPHVQQAFVATRWIAYTRKFLDDSVPLSGSLATPTVSSIVQDAQLSWLPLPDKSTGLANPGCLPATPVQPSRRHIGAANQSRLAHEIPIVRSRRSAPLDRRRQGRDPGILAITTIMDSRTRWPPDAADTKLGYRNWPSAFEQGRPGSSGDATAPLLCGCSIGTGTTPHPAVASSRRLPCSSATSVT